MLKLRELANIKMLKLREVVRFNWWLINKGQLEQCHKKKSNRSNSRNKQNCDKVNRGLMRTEKVSAGNLI